MRPAVLLLALSLVGVAARADEAPPMRHQVSTWEPSSGVSGVTQSPDGFLWVATKTGLQRFDGITFRLYNRSSQPPLPADEVRRVLVTRDGTLWVGMADAGLVRLRGDRFEAFGLAQGLAGSVIFALHEDAAGTLWVGTSQGVSRFTGTGFRSYRRADGLLDDNIVKVFTHHDGTLRVETELGLSRLEGDRFVSEPLPFGGSPERGRLLLPQYIPPGGPAISPDFLQGRPFLVSSFLRDRAGQVWLGTRGGVLQIGPAGEIARIFGVQDGFIADGVNALFEDHDGDIWVATMGGGLSLIARPRLTTLTRLDGLGGDVPRCLVETSDGSVWMTTTQGLSRWKAGVFTNFTPGVDSMLSHSLRTVAAAADGSLWVSVFRGPTVARFRDGRFDERGPAQGFPESPASALLTLPDGAVLLATERGELGRIEGDRYHPVGDPAFACPASPCKHRVVALAGRRAGGAFVATTGDGLHLFDGQTVRPVRPSPPLPMTGLEGLLEEEDGTLWVGSASGLYRVKDGRATRYGYQEGLPDEMVSEMVDDGAGFLWLGCARGLVRVSLAELGELAAGRRPRLNATLFDRRDGVKGEEVVQGLHPLGLRLHDGRLLFATVRGVVTIDAPPRWEKLRAPTPIIDRLLINGVERNPTATPRLDVPPGAGALEIHYTAPTPHAPHHVSFRYRLEGFDPAWVDAGPRRSAYYTNLPPGSYTFHLEASRDDDPASGHTAAAVTFRLRPHFRQTWAFYALVGLAVALAGAGVQRLRAGQVEARFAAVLAERNRIARDLHDALAQVFSAIGFQLDRLAGSAPADDQEGRRRIQQARQMVAHGRLAARNVVANLRAGSEARVPLAQALEELPRIYDATAFVVTVEGAARPLPAPLERELLRIAEEAVSNAIAHGQAQHISIALRFEGEGLELWVRDDGAGFRPAAGGDAEQPGGFGLLGMRERTGRIGGRLQIESEAGVGTEVGVIIDRVPRDGTLPGDAS